jgi:hypothetical protein
MIQFVAILGMGLQLFTANAQADTAICLDRLNTLKGERIGVQQVSQPVINLAAQALEHYRTILKTEPAVTQYSAYYSVLHGNITGYRVTLTAKDKSIPTVVTYYFDVAKKLVYAKQTPKPEETYWFCTL